MTKFKKTLFTALLEAGEILRQHFLKKIKVEYKGEIDPVTEVDRYSENRIIKIMKTAHPTHGILTEETGEYTAQSEFCWIIDPLDGTVNYAHGFNIFSVSIALSKEGTIILGGVYDPLREEMFWAEKGAGAFLNKKMICVSSEKKLCRSLLVTGFPYYVHKKSRTIVKYFSNFLTRAQAIRRLGSACLDLAYVAAGRIDGFWEQDLKPWDMAAGALIVEEAGGKVTDFRGKKLCLFSKTILATNTKLHNQMLKILKPK